jgi:hypothetical protein
LAELSLWHGLPPIRRARGYRLYGHDGRRYLDLWQAGGRAILGHRAGRVTTVLKNVISTGLVADLPSVQGPRFERTLQHLFPGYPAFRVTGSLGAALALASSFLGREVTAGEVGDPLLDPPDSKPEVSLWRPFLDARNVARVLVPLVPFAVASAPVAVGFDTLLPERFPASEVLSPMLLAGSLRALHDLGRHLLPEWLRADLLARAVGWEQRGPYVVPRFAGSRYPEVFARFLEGGMLLNPTYPGASILPSEASPGELEKMIGLFMRFPGK